VDCATLWQVLERPFPEGIMARRTRQQNEETVTVYYGIDPKTFEVARVPLTRGGTLSRMGKEAMQEFHQVTRGRNPQSEVVIVFGLTDIVSVPIQLEESAGTEQRITELRAKAAEMKREAEEKAKM
jgi:hypothetical protein